MEIIKFQDLEDGAEFMFAQTWAYGSRILWQKTLEDGGNHNCVSLMNSSVATLVHDNTLVISL